MEEIANTHRLRSAGLGYYVHLFLVVYRLGFLIAELYAVLFIRGMIEMYLFEKNKYFL